LRCAGKENAFEVIEHGLRGAFCAEFTSKDALNANRPNPFPKLSQNEITPSHFERVFWFFYFSKKNIL
jgi:hypothetical protein